MTSAASARIDAIPEESLALFETAAHVEWRDNDMSLAQKDSAAGGAPRVGPTGVSKRLHEEMREARRFLDSVRPEYEKVGRSDR